MCIRDRCRKHFLDTWGVTSSILWFQMFSYRVALLRRCSYQHKRPGSSSPLSKLSILQSVFSTQSPQIYVGLVVLDFTPESGIGAEYVTTKDGLYDVVLQIGIDISSADAFWKRYVGGNIPGAIRYLIEWLKTRNLL